MRMQGMTGLERRAALSLASIYVLRMLGLFMILPVFALYAQELDGYTPALAGIAIGVYGLTQGLLQIPLATWSDRIGRKPIIIGGLLVFALGSLVAAMSDSVMGVILGRTLQGAGAVAGTVMALAADLTREEHRMKVMAVIGTSIGLSFALALVLGPVLHGWVGVQGIFWVTLGLALAGVAITRYWVPSPVSTRFHRDTEVEWDWLKTALFHPQLIRLDFGVLVLHLMLTATFMSVPFVLRDKLGLDEAGHWKIYLPVLVLSMAAIVPFLIYGERKRRLKQIVVASVSVLLLASLGLEAFQGSLVGTILTLWLFFCGFNLLEASMPSLVAKIAPSAHKGTAMGAFSSSQFMGAFLGGSLGGTLVGHYGIDAVFMFNAVLAGIWVVVSATMANPVYLSSRLLNVGQMNADEAHGLMERLNQVSGVAEAVVIPEDGVAYLKVDTAILDEVELASYSIPDTEAG